MIPDNYDLWLEHDRKQQEKINKLPVCDCCGEPIMDDYYFEDINGYAVICEECLVANHRKDVDDFVAERCDYE